ncbi:MAG: DUF1987 domain-containing protein [Cyclobacteriaceae bacterium]
MSFLLIEAGKNSPFVCFDFDGGTFKVGGRSVIEQPLEFYQQLISSIGNYSSSAITEAHFTFEFEYFNTSSCKCIFNLMKEIKKLEDRKSVVINWYYDKDDEDMLEIGEDFEDILEMPFRMISRDRLD